MSWQVWKGREIHKQCISYDDLAYTLVREGFTARTMRYAPGGGVYCASEWLLTTTMQVEYVSDFNKEETTHGLRPGEYQRLRDRVMQWEHQRLYGKLRTEIWWINPFALDIWIKDDSQTMTVFSDSGEDVFWISHNEVPCDDYWCAEWDYAHEVLINYIVNASSERRAAWTQVQRAWWSARSVRLQHAVDAHVQLWNPAEERLAPAPFPQQREKRKVIIK